MTVCYQVRHQTRYNYASTILGGHQLAHLAPRATPWQTVLQHRVDIRPGVLERSESIDYFGNGVLRFLVDTPHEELVVRAESVVRIASRLPGKDSAAIPWEKALAEPYAGAGSVLNLDVIQYLLASPMVPLLDACADYARSSFPAGRPWLEAVADLTTRIHAEFAYDAEATTVTTQVDEVLAQRRGVCQDFAHLMVSCLRSLGLPARYVSGYVLNEVGPGQAVLTGADASHAWIEAHCAGIGWVAFDPTNGKLADTEFITLGWGREFFDVTPLRGVVLGASTEAPEVAVSVRKIAEPGQLSP
jgi:transglutaminase-like putative cysteine protease